MAGGLFGIDIGQTVQGYQSGGLFGVASNLINQRWGGTANPAGPVPAPTIATVQNPPVQGAPPAAPQSIIGTGTAPAAWYKKPIVWIGAGVGAIALVFVLFRRK